VEVEVVQIHHLLEQVLLEVQVVVLEPQRLQHLNQVVREILPQPLLHKAWLEVVLLDHVIEDQEAEEQLLLVAVHHFLLLVLRIAQEDGEVLEQQHILLLLQ
jgi:hypothetical protein